MNYALASHTADGLLVNYNGKYEVMTDCKFENIEDYNDSVKLFDSKESAQTFIKENDWYGLTPVEFVELKTDL